MVLRVPYGRRGGFTLVEVLVCAILLGIGFLALVAAFGQDSVSTQRGEDVTMATFLADEIRDLALQMSFADVLAMDDTTRSPTVLSTGETAARAGWVQHILVDPVSATNLNQPVGAGAAGAARITVEVRSNSKPVLAQTYYVFKMDGVPFTDSGT
jgi:prepilin-type N-terminal cleavage/methylation domain-containing protein